MSNQNPFGLILLVVWFTFVNSSPISYKSANETSISDIQDVSQHLSNAILSSDSIATNLTARAAIRAKQSKLMQSFMNTSIDPCDNFYDYACGNWEKENPIPGEKWKYSTTQLLQRDLLFKLRDLLSEPIDESELKAGPISATNKAKLFYKYCMEHETENQIKNASLLEYLDSLGAFPLGQNWSEDKFDWIQMVINTASVGNGIIIAFDVVKNPMNPTNYTLYIKQTTLGLVNRDNYMKKENAKNLEAYRHFVKKVFLLMDVDEEVAQNMTKDIVDFEVLLANATLPMEASKTMSFYVIEVKELIKAYSYIDWIKYISGIQGREAQLNQTVIMQLGVQYFENLYYLFNKVERTTLANYIMWRSILYILNNLGPSFRATLDELSKTIAGQQDEVPLWQLCVSQTNGAMGMAVSAIYIKNYFDESSKNQSIQLVNSLKEAFNENLLELDWLDETTRNYAKKKVEAMTVSAGYPDYIRDEQRLNKLYKDVEIVKGKHFENALSVHKHNWRHGRDRLFKAYDRNFWHMPPTVVNALYDFGANRILILASILQPPIFHQDHPQSVNYGAIGMFIGHEIIHGFDDTGRRFDWEGNTFNWWTPKALLHFEDKQKCFLKQYEDFAKEDESFKSIATISENLADNGGLRLAYKAYSKWRKANPAADETFPDFSLNEDQLFFLNFAQTFCAAVRPEALVESKSYEAHSPEKYRILGTLVNFEKFSEAFNCPIGSRYNPVDKCRLW